MATARQRKRQTAKSDGEQQQRTATANSKRRTATAAERQRPRNSRRQEQRLHEQQVTQNCWTQHGVDAKLPSIFPVGRPSRRIDGEMMLGNIIRAGSSLQSAEIVAALTFVVTRRPLAVLRQRRVASRCFASSPFAVALPRPLRFCGCAVPCLQFSRSAVH